MWIVNHRWLGPPIRDWEANKVIRLKYKVISTVMVAGTGAFILYKESIPVWGKIGYFVVVVSAMGYVWTRRSE